MPKPIVVYDSVANELLTPAIAADSVSITESLVIDKNLTVTGNNNVVGTIVITGNATVNNNLVVTGSQTLGGVVRNTWPASGSATVALTDVLTNGEKGNIPAAGAFELRNSTGATTHFAVDEATGQVTKVDLAGMMGNISNPLVDLPLNQLELLPFASGAFTVTSAAAAVANYPSRTIGITLTAGAIAGNVAGQFATIGGVDYPITVVAGAVLTLEYSIDLADPVAGDTIISIWRMAGKYAGNTTFTRSTRKTYIDPLSGLLRAVPAGFPALERMANGKVGYLSEGASTNRILNSGDMTNAAWTKRGTATAVAGAADPFGGTAAQTVTVGSISTDDIFITATGFTASATINNGIWIKRTSTTGILVIGNPQGGANGSTGQWQVDMSLLPDAYIYLKDTHPAVTVSIAHTSGTTGLAGLWFYASTGTITFLHGGSQQEELPFATSYIPTTTAAVTRVRDGLRLQYIGNALRFDLSHKNDITIMVDFDMPSVRDTNMHVMSSSLSHEMLWRITPAGVQHFFGGFNVVAAHAPDITNGQVNRSAYVIHADKTVVGYTNAVAGATGTITLDSNGNATKIFIGTWGSSAQPMYGHIGALKIYDRALTASEIAAA